MTNREYKQYKVEKAEPSHISVRWEEEVREIPVRNRATGEIEIEKRVTMVRYVKRSLFAPRPTRYTAGDDL